MPYWQDYFARSDAIYLKLVSGEIPVGAANRLLIESKGKFQQEVARGHAQAVAEDEARRQRAAEVLLATSAAMQPHTTNCFFVGNMLSCTGT